jgi:hypothetical protein
MNVEAEVEVGRVCKKCGIRKPLAFFAKKTYYRICRACLKRMTGE